MQATKGLYQQLSPFTPVVTATLQMAVASVVSPLLSEIPKSQRQLSPRSSVQLSELPIPPPHRLI